MDEATEICKLRLFLKLAAQVERDESKPNYGLEPLPDIDFNIRAGNTLVGFVDRAAVDSAFAGDGQGKFDFDDHAAIFNEEAEAAELAFELFRLQQTKLGGTVTPKDKAALRTRLKKLSDKLDVFLAHEYGVATNKPLLFELWRKSHQPFHWYTEFFRIIKSGGFDVVIGNPPYVEYGKVKEQYKVLGYVTAESANLFAFCSERSFILQKPTGYFGMIIPISAVSTDRMAALRSTFSNYLEACFLSHYSRDAHPAVLFNGVKMRLSIGLGKKRMVGEKALCRLFTTSFYRWYSEARGSLFSKIGNLPLDPTYLCNGLIPKFGNNVELSLLEKLQTQKKTFSYFADSADGFALNAHRIVAHFVKCFDFIPFFKNDRDDVKKSEDYMVFTFQTKEQAAAACALLNSSTLYLF